MLQESIANSYAILSQLESSAFTLSVFYYILSILWLRSIILEIFLGRATFLPRTFY